MTYFTYLLIFVVLPLIWLIGVSIWDARNRKIHPGFRGGRAILVGSGIIAVMALLYTTPWDNYLVASGVWSYRRDLISGVVLGWVPLEEYLFFVLETFLTGAWWWFIVRRIQPGDFIPFPPASSLAIRIQSLIFLGIAWLAAILILVSGWQPGRYLGLILAWALPVLALQAAFGADILWQSRRLVALTVLPVAAYLSLTDSLAIAAGTWSISPVYSTGLMFGQLPLEEALFFFVTPLIVACGLTLFTSVASTRRFRSSILSKIRKQEFSRET